MATVSDSLHEPGDAGGSIVEDRRLKDLKQAGMKQTMQSFSDRDEYLTSDMIVWRRIFQFVRSISSAPPARSQKKYRNHHYVRDLSGNTRTGNRHQKTE
mmetsp:Transcript_42455/g.88797  ORF Transcript_42455/g.88797 Transcript_42455/m.88797 type:complete len:99 (+) Transcript_42455:3-299(+)